MALLNTGCLFSTIQADVTGVTTGYASDCFVVIAGAVDATTSDRCVTVSASGSLPNLLSQAVPHGQIVFVEDIGVPVVAADRKWMGFDKRILRNDAQGILYTWGCNSKGQLGDGTVTARSSPGTVAGGGTTWNKISNATFFSAGIKNDGTLWTWGYNFYGQLGDGTTTSRSSPGTTAGGGATWCVISVGGSSSAGVKTDGTLWAWGFNNQGQLGDGTSTSRLSPVTTSGGGTNWCFVSVGDRHMAAIKTDGSLWTWGNNGYGKLGDGSTTTRTSPGTVAGGGSDWCSVCAAFQHTVAIKRDGTLWTWGRNTSGQLGDNSTTNRSSPGTVLGGVAEWLTVSAGYQHTAAIKTNNTLWLWGRNNAGQLGDGTSTSRSSPVTVSGGGTTWCSVSAGCNATAAIKTDGTLWTWGQNSFGQLGTGNITNRSSPGTVAGGGTTWCLVYMGIGSALALSST